MEVINTAKMLMAVGLGLIGGSCLAKALIPAKTCDEKAVTAECAGFVAGGGAVMFGIGVGGLLGYAEELASKVVEEVV